MNNQNLRLILRLQKIDTKKQLYRRALIDTRNSKISKGSLITIIMFPLLTLTLTSRLNIFFSDQEQAAVDI